MSNHDPVDTGPNTLSDGAPNTAALNDSADERRDRRSDALSDGAGKGRGIAGQIAAYFIDSPLTPLLLLTTLGIGILGLLTTPRQEDPDISVPMVDIKLRYPGASSGQVARLAVEPLERLMSELSDVEHVYSVSRREQALITVRFEVGTSIDAAVVGVHDTIESNLNQVPPDLTEWLVQPKTIDDVPVLTLTLWSDRIDDARLRMLALHLLQELKQVENTGNGFVVGGRQREISIEPQPELLRGYGISLDQLAETIRGANANAGRGTGSVEQGATHRSVSAGHDLEGAREIERLVIDTKGGLSVYVGDVASVNAGAEHPDHAVFFYTGPSYPADDSAKAAGAVTIAIAKQPRANGVTLTNDLLKRLEQLKGSMIPEQVQVAVTRNYGETADRKVNELLLSLVGATAAVALLSLIAIGLRPALIVLAVIPVVILLTVWSAGALGFSINRVSLFALIFSIGILVDDATVVVENIFRRWLAKGATAKDVALDAVGEVGNPTIIATLTVLAALLPMGFVTGMMGPYMRPIPILGSVAMLFSLFAAFVFTPWLAYRLRPKLAVLERSAQREHRLQGWIDRAYRPLIEPLIERRQTRWLFLIAIIVAFIAAVAMLPLKAVTVKMLPYDNKREIDVVIDLPEGSSLPTTANATHQLAQQLRGIPEVRSLQAYIGTAAPFDFNGLVRHYYLRQDPWLADIQVRLLDKDERKRSSHAIAQVVREQLTPLAKEHDAHINVVEMPPGPPVLQTLVAEVYGPTPGARRGFAEDLTEMFAAADGVVDVDNRLQAPHSRWHFQVDNEKASRNGVDVDSISRNLAMAMGGYSLGDIAQERLLEPVEIKLQMPLATRTQLHRLGELPIPASSGEGRMVPLAELGRFIEVPADQLIYHKDLRLVEYVTAGMEGRLGAPIYGMLQVEQALEDSVAPDGTEAPRGTLTGPPKPGTTAFEWSGEWTVTYKTFRDLGIAFGAALLLIYVLLVAEFRNFIQPAVIMAPIPLTLIGILPGHWLLGAEFTATSMIGFIALAGIEVRNSILLVDFAQDAVRRGLSVRDAVVEAGRTRLRPVWVTDLTMMAGAFAILFDPIFQGMAISLLFGPIVAVPLTLIVVPLGCIATGWAFHGAKQESEASATATH
ncbi:Multidrug transporter MdtB [Thiorhodovibrio winogradskyi]|uniref:Multidrug transporter MdtB n=1 Tax=Thiorhodovibrio winogradskyi TaxID=77007 RepID=A0ABZ0S904_9GAMM|nr:efflux RND transporter permease subunit [Thiorhodovibrio winogradskyi]